MNWAGLITAIAGLVVAITALIKVFKHTHKGASK